MALIAGNHPHVVVEFAAWPARPGVAHLPEIVFRSEFVYPFLRHSDAQPQVVGFGVPRHSVFAFEDRRIQLLLRNAEPLLRSNQFPGVRDGIFLEVVAKRKIPEHLEKRVMAVGEADVFEIVVLAAGAHALLRCRGAVVVALFEPEEDVLELVHAGVGEEERRVVGRNERGGMDLAVTLLDEEVEEFAADLGACEHGKLILNQRHDKPDARER